MRTCQKTAPDSFSSTVFDKIGHRIDAGTKFLTIKTAFVGVDERIHSMTEPLNPCRPEGVLSEIRSVIFCVTQVPQYVVTGYEGLVPSEVPRAR